MDKVDEAIAAAAQPTPPQMAQIPLIIESTGRPAIIAVPLDVTDLEVMELCSWMLKTLRPHIAENLRPAAGLIIARGMPL